MKSEAGIRHKIGQAQFRHLKRALRKVGARRPETCAHHERLSLPGFGDVGFCGKEEGATHAPCDARFGGVERAARCPLWEPAVTEDSVRETFKAYWASGPTLAEVAERFPDVGALLWTISTDPDNPIPPEMVFDPAEHVLIPGPASPFVTPPRALPLDPWGAFPGPRVLVGPWCATPILAPEAVP